MEKQVRNKGLAEIIVKIRSVDCEDWDELITIGELLDAVASELIKQHNLPIKEGKTPTLTWVLLILYRSKKDVKVKSAAKTADILIELAEENEYFGKFFSAEDVDIEGITAGVGELCDVLEGLQKGG